MYPCVQSLIMSYAVCVMSCVLSLSTGCGSYSNLHQAAAAGALKETLAFIREGADPDARDRDRLTPLHWAAALGRVEVVPAFLRAGADVNARDQGGGTPLDYAVYFYQWGSVKRSSVPDGQARPAFQEGRRPMGPEEERDRKELIKLLRAAGAKLTFPDPATATESEKRAAPAPER